MAIVYFGLIFLTSIIMIACWYFIVLFPLKYNALKKGKNLFYSSKLVKYFLIYLGLLGIVTILRIYLVDFLGVVDLVIVLYFFFQISGKRLVVFPTFRQDNIEYEMKPVISKYPKAEFKLSVSKTPYLIYSNSMTEDEFNSMLEDLNENDEIFKDLKDKDHRLLFKLYPLFLVFSIAIQIIGPIFIFWIETQI